ncbi:hypothetical protein HDU82_003261 [Entophlyctis luteolus]|nr:hypothetical protein HDU82_003261 [Entophlyctis luteolus]
MVTQIESLEAQLRELNARYMAALELLGEKTELVEDLQQNIAELRKIQRGELEQLLNLTTALYDRLDVAKAMDDAREWGDPGEINFGELQGGSFSCHHNEGDTICSMMTLPATYFSSIYGTDSVLVSKLQKTTSSRVVTSKKLVGPSQTEDAVTRNFGDSTCITVDLVSADGIRSATRRAIFPDLAKPTFWSAGYIGTFDRGVTSSENENKTWRPHTELPKESKSLGTVVELWGASKESLPRLPSHSIDIYGLPDIPELHNGCVVLVGDAADATIPALGQGLCSGIEDACVLGELIDEFPDYKTVFEMHSRVRIPRVQNINKRPRNKAEGG